MISANKTIFDSYSYDFKNKKIHLKYYVDEYYVNHTIDFNDAINIQYQDNLDQYIFLCGMAIYPYIFSKYNPKVIYIKANFLSNIQLKIWEKWYTKGLGEYFYINKLPHKVNLKLLGTPKKLKSKNLKLDNKYLLLNGGGKDSSVSSEIMNKSNLDYEWFMVGNSVSQQGVVKYSKVKLSNNILSYQKYNVPKTYKTYLGHKPFTLYTSSIAVLLSGLKKFKNVVLSNEKSANYGNLVYNGVTINHQWTKTLEFEKEYSEYLKNYVNSDLNYFSILKPLYELQIAKIFSKYPKYHNSFISCNRMGTKKWCKKCSKCAFIFLALLPFMEKKNVIKIFDEDLLDNMDNKLLFERLVGEKDNKPFECVGTIKENKIAMHMIVNKSEENSKLTKYFENKYTNSKYKDINQFLIQYDENNNIPYEIKKTVRSNTLNLLKDEKIFEGFTSKKIKYNNCIKIDILIFLFIIIILIIRINIY